MGASDSENLVFRALADPTRRAILALLAAEGASVSDICQHFEVSQPAVSQHLRVLRECGLVAETRLGRRHIYTLDAEPLEAARQWLDRNIGFWASSLDRLGHHLRRKHGEEPEV